MGFPVGPYTQVLMISLSDDPPLAQWGWSGMIVKSIPVGQAFWASSRDVPGLLAAEQAEIAPEGTIAPPPEPAHTVHGSPGFGAGTSNSSP